MVPQNEPESYSGENFSNQNPVESNLGGVYLSQNLFFEPGMLVIFGNLSQIISALIVFQINTEGSPEVVKVILGATRRSIKNPPSPASPAPNP
jgi:hypothetical protein